MKLAQSRPLLGRFAIWSVRITVDASAELRFAGFPDALTSIFSAIRANRKLYIQGARLADLYHDFFDHPGLEAGVRDRHRVAADRQTRKR